MTCWRVKATWVAPLNLEAGSIGVKFLDTSTGAVANGN